MKADKQASTPNQTLRMLEVLSSVALGEAGKEDILALMKGEGVESLDMLHSVLRLGRPADARRDKGGRKAAARREHQVPAVPFILNGTLYDPQDVRRFDGTALHFVVPPGKDYMLAVDDLEIMLRWWDILRWSSLEYYQYGGYQFDAPPRPKPDATPPSRKPGQVAPQDHVGVGPEGKVPPHFYLSFLYEDINFEGAYLTTEINRGFEGYDYEPQHYSNLLWEGRGFLGLGDWNDVISSVKIEHGTCVLFEHAFFGVFDGGSDLTLFQSESDLRKRGFNDRASSVHAFV